MEMGIPQLIYTGLVVLGIGNAMAKYGQPKNDKYDIYDVLVAPTIVITLLWFGGFYG